MDQYLVQIGRGDRETRRQGEGFLMGSMNELIVENQSLVIAIAKIDRYECDTKSQFGSGQPKR